MNREQLVEALEQLLAAAQQPASASLPLGVMVHMNAADLLRRVQSGTSLVVSRGIVQAIVAELRPASCANQDLRTSEPRAAGPNPAGEF